MELKELQNNPKVRTVTHNRVFGFLFRKFCHRLEVIPDERETKVLLYYCSQYELNSMRFTFLLILEYVQILM